MREECEGDKARDGNDTLLEMLWRRVSALLSLSFTPFISESETRLGSTGSQSVSCVYWQSTKRHSLTFPLFPLSQLQ